MALSTSVLHILNPAKQRIGHWLLGELRGPAAADPGSAALGGWCYNRGKPTSLVLHFALSQFLRSMKERVFNVSLNRGLHVHVPVDAQRAPHVSSLCWWRSRATKTVTSASYVFFKRPFSPDEVILPSFSLFHICHLLINTIFFFGHGLMGNG